jgi:hypothetical protein
MDGMRILDEWTLIKDKLTLDAIFVKKVASPDNLSEEEQEIFNYVDGESDVSTIIDLSSKDNFQASNILLALVEKKFIELLETKPAVTEAKVIIEKKETPAFLGYLPYIVVFISLIISLAATVLRPDSAFKEFNASDMIERLRFKVETHRIEHTTYPQKLELVSDAKDPWGNAFSYRASADYFEIMSAGPDGKEGTEDDIH